MGYKKGSNKSKHKNSRGRKKFSESRTHAPAGSANLSATATEPASYSGWFWSGIESVRETLASVIMENVGNALDTAVETGEQYALAAVKGTATTVGTTVTTGEQYALAAAKGTAAAVGTTVTTGKQYATTAAEYTAATVETTVTTAGQIGQYVAETLTEKVQSAGEFIEECADDLTRDTKRVTKKALGAVVNTGLSAVASTGLDTLPKKAFDAVASTGLGALPKKALGAVANTGLGTATKKVFDAVKNTDFATPLIQGLAASSAMGAAAATTMAPTPDYSNYDGPTLDPTAIFGGVQNFTETELLRANYSTKAGNTVTGIQGTTIGGLSFTLPTNGLCVNTRIGRNSVDINSVESLLKCIDLTEIRSGGQDPAMVSTTPQFYGTSGGALSTNFLGQAGCRDEIISYDINDAQRIYTFGQNTIALAPIVSVNNTAVIEAARQGREAEILFNKLLFDLGLLPPPDCTSGCIVAPDGQSLVNCPFTGTGCKVAIVNGDHRLVNCIEVLYIAEGCKINSNGVLSECINEAGDADGCIIGPAIVLRCGVFNAQQPPILEPNLRDCSLPTQPPSSLPESIRSCPVASDDRGVGCDVGYTNDNVELTNCREENNFRLVQGCNVDLDSEARKLINCPNGFPLPNTCSLKPTQATTSSSDRALGLDCLAPDDDKSIGCDVDTNGGGAAITNCRDGNFAFMEGCDIDLNTKKLTSCFREYMNGCNVGPTEAVASSTARSLGATCRADDDRGTGCDLDFSNGGSELTNCREGNFQLVEECTIDSSTNELTSCTHEYMDGCTIGSTEAVCVFYSSLSWRYLPS